MIQRSPVLPVYQRLPVCFERGEGAYLWDTQGKRYLDALSGIAVTGLGHHHPAITPVIQQQAAKLLHCSNLFEIDSQIALAEALAKRSGLPVSFFNNSGAEAVETAIKAARLYGHSQQISTPKIVVFEGGFHGRTMACLSASSNPKHREGFEPLLSGFIRVAFNDLSALEAINDPDVIAVLIEPIQGESGVRVPQAGYLKQLSALCQARGWLLMVDEIQTGMGRTGEFFCYEHEGITPDVVMLAKGLANGLPIGACLLSQAVADLFEPGMHGSTFGGNPLVCETALATLGVFDREKPELNASKQGQYLLSRFRSELDNLPQVIDVRGKGLMMGIELDQPCRPILLEALQKGVLFNIANQTVIRILPPLILNESQSAFLADTVIELVKAFK